MLMRNAAAHGSWKSPITSDLVAQSITLSEARFDGEDIYWLEGRPQELGRLVVVRANALDGHATFIGVSAMSAKCQKQTSKSQRALRENVRTLPTAAAQAACPRCWTS
jgi:hypothetical protein